MTYRSNRSGGVRLTRGIGMVVERFDSSPDNEIMFNPKMIFSGESINIVEKVDVRLRNPHFDYSIPFLNNDFSELA